MNVVQGVSDWLELLWHFLSLSLLAVGGAITTVPDMHRYLVEQQHWVSDSQFNASIALAQAAPGPNLLFVAVLGWNVGINAAGGVVAGAAAWPWGLLGVLITMSGILLPSTTLALFAARWARKNQHWPSVRAFKSGMAPIVIALLGATGWILTAGLGTASDSWRLWLATALVTVVVWRTRIHLLWLIAGGALLGALGWV